MGTFLLLLVIAGCVRLGFWQLSRHEQRQERNAGVAARLELTPLPSAAALADTSGIFYRTTSLTGTWDNERSIVLPGRSYRGVPGVHLLTPLRLPGSSAAVLVNRGWVPAPDAATIDVAEFADAGSVAVTGLVLPFPGADQSLAQRRGGQARDEAFRRVWYTVDEAALRSQYPYPLLDVTVQALPEPGVAAAGRGSYPARLEPPPLDGGPHFGYALQWFGFAIIGIIGWVALVLRSRLPPRSVAPRAAPPRAPPPPLLAVLLLAGAAPASAQLRPLDPAEWRVFDDGVRLVAEAGTALLRDQRASLAGTSGTLIEAGNYALTFRSARMAISLSGTAVLRLLDEEVYAAPHGAARPTDGKTRRGSGRAIAATLFRVSPRDWPVDLLVRFGAVLPTTSHRSGLDRDRTDFFALAGARWDWRVLSLTTEHGVGVNGTITDSYPQSDVWVYNAGASLRAPAGLLPAPLRAVAELAGHEDGHDWVVRGNEDQQEIRLGFDLGDTWLLRVRHIRGRTAHSPSTGWRIGGGVVVR
jgi:surfeit locus 1 family protein